MNAACTSRFLNKAQAMKLYTPSKVEELDKNILTTDTLADAVIDSFARLHKGAGWTMVDDALKNGIDAVENPTPELIALFKQIDHVPEWVDWEQLERGAISFWRPGFLTGLAMLGASLVSSYRSGAAVVPLVITGRLVERAEKRKMETSRWALRASAPGMMHRYEEGFAYTVRVRLIHTFVRRKLAKMPEWDYDAWGAPINLTDMSYGISAEFTTIPMQALAKLGINYSAQERADMYALWRYIGYVVGVPESLLPTSEEDALERLAIREITDTPPDENSQELAKALIETGGDDVDDLPRIMKLFITQKRMVSFLYGQARYFAGDELADQFAMPDTKWKYVMRAFKPIVGYYEKRRFKKGVTDRERATQFIQLAWDMLDEKGAEKSIATEDSLTPDIAKNRKRLTKKPAEKIAAVG